ncbi:hypothetical protein [Nocardia caishijiensis]|uniref:hypothetical protein n=1 Tax=Nocardia caishijiensis TaxID=184756 RepID=UPI00082DAF2A|nr:hypothetical protein [Nocardia caishijiensis]
MSTLRDLIEYTRADVIGARIRDHADLRCVSEPRFRSRTYTDTDASDSDYERWRSATEELLASIGELQTCARVVTAHLDVPRGRSVLARQWWHIRYANRNRSLRANYDTDAEQLCAEFDRALAAYEERAGDLPAFLAEDSRRKQQRAHEEWRRREEAEQRKRAQDRQRRSDALAAAVTGPQWAYRISESPSGRIFSIYLTSLDGAAGCPSGLTVAEVQAALVAERAEHPYTAVMWAPETRRALEDEHASRAAGWEVLTGEPIDPHPRDPSARRSGRYHGPSSNYGSDSHSGCGGGGFSGGFGGYR